MPAVSNKIDESHETSLTRRLPDDLRNSEVVRALVSDPLPTVVAIITAALGSGHEQMLLAGGRVAQAVLKGRTLKQVAREIDELHKKGKIREDYANTKYGFRAFVELMTMIDSDTPDDDKLDAAKAMFIAVNSPHAPKGEEFLRYQLFRLVLKLSGSQVVLLSICNKLRKKNVFDGNVARTAQNWLNSVANHIGHRVLSLIEQDETALMKFGIITPRLQADHSGADLKDARLSDLGVTICELIESYSGDLPRSNAQKG